MDKEYNLFKGSLAEHISKTGFRDNETNHYEHEESDDEEIEQKSEMNKSVEELFKSVGLALAHYSTGPLPKAIKIVPKLENWEEALEISRPFSWTPSAVLAVTKIFSSNLDASTVEIFLLPICRRSIAKSKRLDTQLYQALKKATFKPAPFFRGVVVALLKDGGSVKEAKIIASVVAKASIPALHSAAALILLLRLKLSMSQLTVLYVLIAKIQSLLNKKYSLPVSIIDKLCDFYSKFAEEELPLPVLWHQTLLLFVSTYCESLSSQHKLRLRELCKRQKHAGITPEIVPLLETV